MLNVLSLKIYLEELGLGMKLIDLGETCESLHRNQIFTEVGADNCLAGNAH